MRFYLLYRNHGLYDPVLDDTEDYYVPIESVDLTDTLLEEIEKEKSKQQKIDLIHKHDVTPNTELSNVPVAEDQSELKDLYDALLKISTDELLPPTVRFKLPVSEEYDPEGKKVTKLQKLYNKNVITIDLKSVVDTMRQQENKVIDNLEQTQKTLETEVVAEKKDEMTKKELQYSHRHHKNLDLESIQKTATQIVDDSINKAMSVAKEIKQEINVELKKISEIKSESKVHEQSKRIVQSESQLLSDKTTSNIKEVSKKETNISISEKPIEERVCVANEVKKIETLGVSNESNINLQEIKTINKNLEKDRLNVAEEIKKFETLEAPFESISNLEERKLLTKQDIEETIQEGTVRRRSEMLSKENNKSESFMKKSDISSETIYNIDTHNVTKQSLSDVQKPKIHETTEGLKEEGRMSNVKKDQRKAYSLGMQTVPHLREVIYTSSNSNLLLKTFFLQLTKIMVALSKYLMLEQTITNHDASKVVNIEKECDENLQQYNIHRQEDKTAEEFMKQQNEENFYEIKDDKTIEDDHSYSFEDTYIEGDIIKKTKLSGAKIAQIEGLKPVELTDKMDVVISELQRKSGIEEHTDKEEFFHRSNRSRSKSKSGIDKNINRNEVGDDSQQNHFFDQREKNFDRRKLFETYETKTTSMDIKEMITEKRTSEHRLTKTEKHVPRFKAESKMETDLNKYEYKSEINENIKNKDNLMYVAIVESHVYTNKDAIFEEKMRQLSLNKTVMEEHKSEKQNTEVSTKQVDTVATASQTLSLAESAIIKPVKLSLAVQPMEDTLLKYARSNTEIEQVSKKIAVQNIVQAIEPILQFESLKVSDKRAQGIIEMPTKILAETTDVTTEEQKMFFKAEVTLTQRSFVSIEEPEPTVEITEVTVETDEVVPVEELKPIEKETHPIIEIPVKSLAEISEIITLEAMTEEFEVPKPINKTHTTDLEKTVLGVAETMIASAEYSSEEIVPPNAITEQAKLDIGTNVAVEITEVTVETDEVVPVEELKPIEKETHPIIEIPVKSLAEISEIITLEAMTEEFEVPKPINKTHTTDLEKTVLGVAETMIASAEYRSEEIVTPNAITEQAKLDIRTNVAVEISEVFINEEEQDTFHIQEILGKYPETSLESSALPVAETLSTYYSEPKDESFEIPKVIGQQATSSVKEFNATEIGVVYSEEPKNDEFVVSKHKMEQPKIHVDELEPLVSTIVFPEEPKQQKLELPDVTEKLPKILIENCPLTVALSLAILLAGPKDGNLDIPSIISSQPKTLIETPNLTVAEVLTLFPEGPKDGCFNVPEVKSENVNINIQEFISLITTIVMPLDQHRDLELLKMDDKFPQISRESNFLAVATSLAILLQGPKDSSFDVEKLAPEKPNIDFVEFKAPISAIMIPETPKEENLEIPAVVEKLAQISIEDHLLTAPEALKIEPEGPNFGSFETTKPEIEHIKIDYNKFNAVEATVVSFAESLNQNIQVPVIEKKQPQVSIEEPKTVEAKIEEVEIQAKIKIPIIPDTSINEVSAEYSIEIPKEKEDVYVEFGFREKKKEESEIYESIKLMKKREFQRQSMEASYSLVRELQTQISIAEIEGLEAEFIKSGSISSSSSQSSSPLTPLIEEYLFRLKGPWIWSRYRTLEDVFEEASLKLKSRIQKSTVQNFEASLTLILQDVAMAQYESDMNDIEVIEIEDYEDIRSLHFSSALLAKSHYTGSFMSSQSAAAAGESSSLKQSSISKQSLESSLTAKMELAQASSVTATQLLSTQKSEMSSTSMTYSKHAHIQAASAELHSVSQNEVQANMMLSSQQEFQAGSKELSLEQASVSKIKARAQAFEVSPEASSKSMEASMSKQTLIESDSSLKSASLTMEDDRILSVTTEKQEETIAIADSSLKSTMSTEADKNLSVITDMNVAGITRSKTPSPILVPPTPLTDEYMFTLQAQMPEPSQFIPRDCSMSPERAEDVIILKGGLIPHIRTTIERILYSPPLISPPTSPDATVPIYSKPGVKSGVFKFLS